VADQIPTRYRLRLKQRKALVDYACAHGVGVASRHFHLDRRTVRTWAQRWRIGRDAGLVPRYPDRRKRRIAPHVIELIRVASIEHRWGAPRTAIWLERVHGARVNTRTIQRVFRDFGMPYLTRTKRRRPKQLRLFEKDQPGDSLQANVKVVRLGRQKIFQYTALDHCTRWQHAPAVHAAKPSHKPAVSAGSPTSTPVYDPATAVRPRDGVSARPCPSRPSGWPPAPIDRTAMARTEREGRKKSQDRRRRVLEPSPLHLYRRWRARAAAMGTHLQP